MLAPGQAKAKTPRPLNEIIEDASHETDSQRRAALADELDRCMDERKKRAPGEPEQR